MKVRIGSHLNNKGGQLVDVEEIHPHPQFNRLGLDYDYGLVKLSEDITFSKHVQPVKLASRSQKIPADTECMISGWGRTKFVFYFHY